MIKENHRHHKFISSQQLNLFLNLSNEIMKEIEQGTVLELSETTTDQMSAASIGSGALDVFSTPSMIALMEKTSMLCVATFLSDSETTVGGAVDIRHYRPTRIGKEVLCKTIIKSIKDRKVDFKVEVFENEKLIGDGIHTRFVVDKESFMKNV